MSKWVVEDVNNLPGTELTFTCDDGLTLVPDGSEIRTCQGDGLWSNLAAFGGKEQCLPGMWL